MNRLRLVLVLAALAASLAVTSSASAATPDRCRAQRGEQVLARSAQAVVLQRFEKATQHFPLQTVLGCSRYSGKRRILEFLQRRTAEDQTKLVGVKLAGTRVAYVMRRVVDGPTTALIADDAIHGGRRHDLSAGGWPFGGGGNGASVAGVQWAVDAQGDVAWITTDADGTGVPAKTPRQELGAWRPGLGRRQIDSHAALSDATLSDGVLRWQRGGAPRLVDLAHVPASHCPGLQAGVGTLDVDMANLDGDGAFTACARATGKTLTQDVELPQIADANGPYVVLAWSHVESYVTIMDLANGTADQIRHAGTDSVIDEHGSLAWISNGLWVRDAAGTRMVSGLPQDTETITGPLQRDGSTVTWPGTGVTVTMNP